jgi:acyl-CoA synthetase (AMP-forming)/AMP-acid ligase II
MLKVGGENVSAAEVEAVVVEDPRVRAVQAVGVADPRLEEVVGVVIEVIDGAPLPTHEEIVAMFRGRLATFKHPRYVALTSEWPMSATKILKHEVRRRLNEAVEGRDGAGVELIS